MPITYSQVPSYVKKGLMKYSMYDVPDTSNDPEYKSATQMLVGGPNPKTLIPPPIVAPIADISFWRKNNLVNHSHINTMSETEGYNSGYYIQPTEDFTHTNTVKPDMVKPVKIRNLTDAGEVKPTQPIREPYVRSASDSFFLDCNGNVTDANKCEMDSFQNNIKGLGQPEPVNRDHNNKRSINVGEECIDVSPHKPGTINTPSGYYPCNVNNELPTNFEATRYDQDPDYRSQRENIFTQTIQPGIFDKNEIIEPINSNIGISFNGQLQPTTIESNGNVMNFIQRDPRLSTPSFAPPTIEKGITESDVYDPRHTGYGECYRSYIEPVTGQRRYMYDDINAVRMPNYISRSDIDFASYADKYGTIPAGWEEGNPNTKNIHELANASFMNASLQRRSELQQLLMRKSNAKQWQNRMYPKRTM